MANLDPVSADFARKHPGTFAKVLGKGEVLDIVRVLKQMPPSVAASVVARLPSSRAGAVVKSSQELLSAWLAEASYDDALTLLGHMPREKCLSLVNSLASRERRRKLLQFLKYPTHCVGALVTDVFVRISADMPAMDALRELRALKTDNPGPIVVLQSDGRYLGLLDLWRLLARDPPTGILRDYVSRVPAMLPETPLTSAALDTNWQRYNWLPVIDHEQRVLGGVSRDRIFAATATQARAHGGQEILTSLATEMLRLIGALLDRILGGRTAP